MDISIRALTQDDKEQLERVYTSSVKAEFPEYSDNLKEFYASGKYLEKMMGLSLAFGAFDGDQLIGFIIAESPFGGIVFAHWLAVIKNYQKKGVGKRLVQILEEAARSKGAHGIHLEADARNVPFYESLGYTVLGHDNKGYFGLDEYFMKKELQDPKEEHYLK